MPTHVANKAELLKALNERLNLPDYFGFNWDALFECLRDFNWVKERLVVVVHRDLPALSENDLKIYLSLLSDASFDWKPGDEHQLEVVFHEKLR